MSGSRRGNSLQADEAFICSPRVQAARPFASDARECTQARVRLRPAASLAYAVRVRFHEQGATGRDQGEGRP